MRPVAILLLMILAGAQALAYDLDKAAEAFQAGVREQPKLMPIHGGWQGSDSAVTDPSIERILDADAWARLWKRHAPNTQAPRVDFSTDMVIAVFFGEIAASRLRLSAVTKAWEIEVLADIETLTDISITGVVGRTANQYLFVVLPRSPERVVVTSRELGIMQRVWYRTIGDLRPLGTTK